MVTTPLSNDSSSSSSAIPPPVRSQGKAPRFAEDIVLEVKRLSKRFDDALAVDDVNLQVKRVGLARVNLPYCACLPVLRRPAKGAFC